MYNMYIFLIIFMYFLSVNYENGNMELEITKLLTAEHDYINHFFAE